MTKETKSKATGAVISVIVAAFVILGWGIAFGYIKRDVHYIGKQSTANTDNIILMEDKVDTIKDKLTRIDTRQEMVIKGIDKIHTKLDGK